MLNLVDRPAVSSGLLDLPRTIEEMLERFWRGPGPAQAEVRARTPRVDVLETPSAYRVLLDIPGVPAEAVDVTVSGDVLTIRGERRGYERQKEETSWRSERPYGAFERSFTFPVAIAADGVEAEAKDGVLTVRVMKAKEAQPRKITIRKR